MKLRAIILSVSFAMAAVQAPVHANPRFWGWTTALTTAAKDNMAAIATAGIGLISIVEGYRNYQENSKSNSLRIESLNSLKSLHMKLAVSVKDTPEYQVVLNEIQKITNLSPDVSVTNSRLLALLAASQADANSIADSYTHLYRQIKNELAQKTKFIQIPSIVSEVVTDPDTYLTMIF